MADNRNNDQSLITNNNYNNRDNSTSSNTDMYLEQVANSLSSVAEGMKNLQKQLSDSNKESANPTTPPNKGTIKISTGVFFLNTNCMIKATEMQTK